ncbi:MAG: hypothetical protein J6V26_04140 [Alistipes sp.]|nr:hypothetical protein [Alistipes sp.]
MKDRILHIIAFVMMSLVAISCSTMFDDDTTHKQDNYITLSFSTPGVETRGEVADNEYESAMSHLDVIIYEYNSGAYTPFHYERVRVSATPSGKATISKTKRDFKEMGEYRFFIIANSTLESSAYYDDSGNILDYNTFLKLDQTDNYIHLSGIEYGVQGSIYPQMFLMDGVAYMGNSEPTKAGNIVINDPATEEDITIKVTLRRAAAKVQISITPGDKVKLTQELMAQSSGYMVRNMPVRTTLTAEGGYPLNNAGANPYWKSSTISQTPYFELIPVTDGEGKITNYQVKLTLYCYSHTWNKDEVFERGTSVVVMIPMIYDGMKYINNYYQISFSKKEGTGDESYHLIKRNTYYDLRINLNAPGAEDFNEPETIKDITYFTAPWERVDLEISGENTVKYLKVNKEKIYMYNISDDTSTLYFSSSSPVDVEFVSGSAYYYNKYNVKTALKDSAVDIYATTEEGSISGNIAVHSDIPTNHTIRYFQLKVTNEEGMTEIIDVEQYPLIYITNNLPWYSYRDDYYYRTTGGHKWNGSVEKSTTSGDLPTTYQYNGDHIVSIYKIDDVNVDTKEVKYTYSSAASSSSNGGTGWTVSKVRGNKQNNSENYAIQYYYFTYSRNSWSKKETNCENHNVRNYHVRMMASSDEYTLGRPALDEYGYTSGDEENSKLVSPSFVIASRLGAVLSTYSGLSNMSNDKKLVAFADHCKNYVEVDDENDDKKAPVKVYDNWRLPTEAELKIIIDIQGKSGQSADAIDYLLNGGYYMSASGPVFNPKNNDSTTELADPMKATGVAIRCVRDAY